MKITLSVLLLVLFSRWLAKTVLTIFGTTLVVILVLIVLQIGAMVLLLQAISAHLLGGEVFSLWLFLFISSWI